MNENQLFNVDKFCNEVIEQVIENTDNKQEKFRIVYRALNTFVRKAPEINDSRTFVNGVTYLLAFLNNKPIDGFHEGKQVLGKSKEKYISILKQEFN